MEDIGNKGIKFYTSTVDACNKKGASMEARLLFALKTIAYGVPPRCLRDHFGMSLSFASQCCVTFDETILDLYEDEYLRLPDKKDLEGIAKLHKYAHGFDGMFGSLDCMHTVWKNCPTGWQGSYKGKEKQCTIVLEAIADYNLWFWHAAYGYAGTLNDKTILSMSPWLGSLLNGSFAKLEECVVPYRIGKESFKEMFVLVDGIYPAYT